MKVLFQLLAAVLLCVLRCGGQSLELAQLDHRAWTVQDGAPLAIDHVAQDVDGTLWLGSEESGLYNFDGFRFTAFDPGLSAPTYPGGVNSLYAAKDGDIWVGFAMGGIAVLRHHQVVRLYTHGDGLPSGSVEQVLQSPDGTIFAIVRGSLFRLHAGHWDEDRSANSLGSPVEHIFFDRTGTFWLCTDQWVFFKPVGQSRFIKTAESTGFIRGIAEDKDGGIWILSVTTVRTSV